MTECTEVWPSGPKVTKQHERSRMNITRRKNEWSRLLRDGRLDECRRITRHFFRRRDMMIGELEEAFFGLKDSPAPKDEQQKLVRLVRRELERDDETVAPLRSLVGVERPTNDPSEAEVKKIPSRETSTPTASIRARKRTLTPRTRTLAATSSGTTKRLWRPPPLFNGWRGISLTTPVRAIGRTS